MLSKDVAILQLPCGEVPFVWVSSYEVLKSTDYDKEHVLFDVRPVVPITSKLNTDS